MDSFIWGVRNEVGTRNKLSFLNLSMGIYVKFEGRFGAATNYKSVALPIEL